MKNWPAVLFYIKKSKVDQEGKSIVYLRITVEGRRAECSTRKKVSVNHWNARSSKAVGNTQESYLLNSYLSKIKNDIFQHYQRMLQDEEVITAMTLRDRYLSKGKKSKMLLEIFEDHNQQVEKLVGKDFAAGTLDRYRTAKKHVGDFIRAEYGQQDLPVEQVDHKFISGFEYYLKTTRKCGHNSALKYITNFKKIIRIAFANDWIQKDPFLHWKNKLKIVEREFLSEKELELMYNKNLPVERLQQVRDIFLFCCFTGLAYADVKKLSVNDIVIGMDGEKWIKTHRTKTKTRSSIPILPAAGAILEKYKDHCQMTGNLLPVLSNQKMNAYLKEIADICGISKNLTFHLARHTFATTVTLSNGVPIESVSKMLGHTSVRTTQHYAKVLDKKLSEDMQNLKLRLERRG